MAAATELSPYHLRVLKAAANGYDQPATASMYGRSVNTIKQQRKEVLRRLGAQNMTHAVAIAFARGVLDQRDIAGDN